MCAGHAACATKEEKNLNRYSLLLTLTSDERTNERFSPLISRDRSNAFATQDAPCHRRPRCDWNSITKLFSRPRSPWTNFHSVACVRAQGHGSHCQTILQPRERHSSRRKCSYPASRIVAMGSSVSRAMDGTIFIIFFISEICLVFSFFKKKWNFCKFTASVFSVFTFVFDYFILWFFLWLFLLIISIEEE